MPQLVQIGRLLPIAIGTLNEPCSNIDHTIADLPPIADWLTLEKVQEESSCTRVRACTSLKISPFSISPFI